MFGKGVVYIALRDTAYLGMTLLSIASLRASGNKYPISIISDISTTLWQGQQTLNYDIVKVHRTDESAMRAVARYKAHILDYSPYRKTLLLDSDVIVSGSLDGVWKGGGSLALAKDACQDLETVKSVVPTWASEESWKSTLSLVGPKGIHYNIGLMYVDRTNDVRRFSAIWWKEITRFASWDVDQIAFMRALRLSKIRIRLLEQKYNTSVRQFHGKQIQVPSPRVIHYNGIARADSDRMMQHMLDKVGNSGGQKAF